MVNSTKIASNITCTLSPASAIPMDYKVAWAIIFVVVPLLGLCCIVSCFFNFCAWKWIKFREKKQNEQHIELARWMKGERWWNIGVFSDTDSGEDLRPNTLRSNLVAQTSFMENSTSLPTFGQWLSATVTHSPNSGFSGSELNVNSKIASSVSRVVSPHLGKTTLSPIDHAKSDCKC